MVRVHPCLPIVQLQLPKPRNSLNESGHVTLPDGSSRTVPAGTPVRDVAAAISPRPRQGGARRHRRRQARRSLLSARATTRRSASSPIEVPEALPLVPPQHGAPAGGGGDAACFPARSAASGRPTDEGFFYDFVVDAPVRARGSRGDREEDARARAQDLRLRAPDVAARGGEARSSRSAASRSRCS